MMKKILGGSNTVIKHTISTNDTPGIYSHSALHLEHLIFDYKNGPCARGLILYEESGTIILQQIGSGTINNVTMTGYANAGIAMNGTHVKCTNISSHVLRSPLIEDAFPFLICPSGEDITVDGFDFSGERVLFHNPDTDPDAKNMMYITFRNGVVKTNRHAGFQFNTRTKGFQNLTFENVRVEYEQDESDARAVFLDCYTLDWSRVFKRFENDSLYHEKFRYRYRRNDPEIY